MTISPSSLTAGQLIEARQLLGWRQEDLAGRAGISRASVSQFEIGTRRPSDWVLVLILRAFDDAGIEFKDGAAQLKGSAE
jgi:transcriptional regulator with XRE-family HTH domain